MSDALLSYDGDRGQGPHTVISHEQAQREDIDWHYLASVNIAEIDVGEAYQANITWQAQSAIV